MADPDEGVTRAGTIRTGARRDRVPGAYEQLLDDAAHAARDVGASLYVYGSVANGTASPGRSDVDLLAIGLPDAWSLADQLSTRYADLCRGVEIASFDADDLAADTDEAYGNRAFLRHYCVHLEGPDAAALLPDFPADARAARGFNGDIGRSLSRWRAMLPTGPREAGPLGVRVARKTLLAVAGLVSVHDRTWTTDRSRATQRWGEVQPASAAQLRVLHSWVEGASPSLPDVEHAIADDGVVAAVVESFRDDIGLWRE
jgi:uncharacterized protein